MRKKLSNLFTAAAGAAKNIAWAREAEAVDSVAAATELTTRKKLVQAPHFLPSKKFQPPKKTKKSICGGDGVGAAHVLSRLNKAADKSQSKAIIEAEDIAREVTTEIRFMLGANSDTMALPSTEPNDGMLPKNILDKSWYSDSSQFTMLQRKEASRNRKQKWIFKNTESRRFNKLMRMCADKLGTESTLDLFDKFGRGTGIKEYNALIKLCISKARESKNNASLVHIHKVYQLFNSMRESGLQLEEESFGPFLVYMIDSKMVEEFQIFSELIKDINRGAYYRICYYEMLLWIRVGDEDKVQELCNSVGDNSDVDCFNIAESYLLAFCDSDREKELQELLEVIDITRISTEYVSSIFKSLGRLQLENFIENFILTLKTTGPGEEKASPLIYDYATSIPNLAVEEIISKFSNLHEQLGVIPSVASCERLIELCCNSSKVHAAIDVIDLIIQFGLEVRVEILPKLLHACEQRYEFDMVRPIFSVIRRHNLKPNGAAFKCMISLYMRLKDFEGAYNILSYMEEINERATASMYNAIMAGYFREKNIGGALMVLKQMEHADIIPDSETYTYLITNCNCEEDVLKYRDQIRLAGVQTTKHVYMAVINAYANFGNFELAKQVVLDCTLSSKHLNEVKSALVSALSSNGQMSDALNVYDEIKQAGYTVEPKAVVNLIEHHQSEGELDTLLRLLEELKGSSNWFDGCSRVVLYCVQYNLANSAIELLTKLTNKDERSTYIVIDQIFSHIWNTEPTNIEIGFELLHAIKEELHLHPSRTSLDFLLSSCVKVKDSQHAQLVWSEYEKAGLSYNVLSFLRMYQALLASGRRKAAKKLLTKIPTDDPHVNYIIKSCKVAFMNS